MDCKIKNWKKWLVFSTRISLALGVDTSWGRSPRVGGASERRRKNGKRGQSSVADDDGGAGRLLRGRMCTVGQVGPARIGVGLRFEAPSHRRRQDVETSVTSRAAWR